MVPQHMQGHMMNMMPRPMMPMMGPQYNPPPQVIQQKQEAKPEVEVEEQVEGKTQLENAELKDTTAAMIMQMEGMNQEKFEQSEFLGFLKKLNTGGYNMQDNTIIEDPDKIAALEKNEQMRKDLKDVYNNMKDMKYDDVFGKDAEAKLAAQGTTGPFTKFEDIWKDKEPE